MHQHSNSEVYEAVEIVLQVEVPPEKARVLGPVTFPGLQFTGTSVALDKNGKPKLRIPTVFSPFHNGVRFQVPQHSETPGTTLHFSNMTVALPNVTYEGLYDSGFMKFFDLGERAHLCFSNRCELNCTVSRGFSSIMRADLQSCILLLPFSRRRPTFHSTCVCAVFVQARLISVAPRGTCC
jgi:hypothetical protein